MVKADFVSIFSII